MDKTPTRVMSINPFRVVSAIEYIPDESNLIRMSSNDMINISFPRADWNLNRSLLVFEKFSATPVYGSWVITGKNKTSAPIGYPTRGTRYQICAKFLPIDVDRYDPIDVYAYALEEVFSRQVISDESQYQWQMWVYNHTAAAREAAGKILGEFDMYTPVVDGKVVTLPHPVWIKDPDYDFSSDMVFATQLKVCDYHQNPIVWGEWKVHNAKDIKNDSDQIIYATWVTDHPLIHRSVDIRVKIVTECPYPELFVDKEDA